MKNKNLLGNLEDETPVVLVENGYKKQGRGMFCFFLMAFFALFLSGKAWARNPIQISSLSDITDSNGSYIITQNISGGTAGVSTFSGTLTAQLMKMAFSPSLLG